MTKFFEPDEATHQARSQWQHRGATRPEFAAVPGLDQESVWDYPRPPRIEPYTGRVEIWFEENCIASTTHAQRILETAGPPTYYLPPQDTRMEWLKESGTQSFCEWKGLGVDLDLIFGVRSVAWTYPKVFPEFAAIQGWLAFYPARVKCLRDGLRVLPQPGHYYGGWVTDEVVGPFKGEPGIEG